MATTPDDEVTGSANDERTRAAVAPGGAADDRDREGRDEPRHVSHGRYRLGAVLGEGGMAIVYEADDSNLKRTVALKQLRAGLDGDPEARRRFFAEAEILASLDHSGLISVHEAGVLAGSGAFYTMSKVRGKTLADLMAADLAAGLRVALRLVDVVQRAAETVGYAHGRGIIHLDLKPQNIMVDEDGAVLVMDWGIARRTSERSAPGVLLGTPSYMSPEAATGNATDPRSDVFGLGVILYQVLTGQRPFLRDSVAATIRAVQSFTPIEPRKLVRHVPRELSAICMKAIEKNPTARYATAREMAADLRDYRNFLPITAAQPTLRERAAKWMRRHPRAVVGLATAAIAVLVFGSIRVYRVAAERAAVEAFWQQYQAVSADVERLEAELAAAVANGASDPAAELARAELRERIRLRTNDSRSIGAAMIGVTRRRPDPRIVSALSTRIRHDVADAQASGDYVRVKVLAETRLELIDEIADQLAWPAEDVAFLRRALQDAQVQLKRTP